MKSFVWEIEPKQSGSEFWIQLKTFKSESEVNQNRMNFFFLVKRWNARTERNGDRVEKRRNSVTPIFSKQ